MHAITISKGKKREKGWEKKTFEEIIANNFEHLKGTENLQTQESQQTSKRVNFLKTTLRYILIKLLKTRGKEKISKVSRDKDKGLYCGKV